LWEVLGWTCSTKTDQQNKQKNDLWNYQHVWPQVDWDVIVGHMNVWAIAQGLCDSGVLVCALPGQRVLYLERGKPKTTQDRKEEARALGIQLRDRTLHCSCFPSSHRHLAESRSMPFVSVWKRSRKKQRQNL
jgi:hypothetical protein